MSSPAVPVGHPEVVGEEVAGTDFAGDVGDAGGAAAVDAGDVAERVQLRGPGGEEGEGGAGGAGGARVGLHVEVDRVAGTDPDALRVFDGVVGLRGPLPGRLVGAELGAAAAAARRRLQADVGRDQAPAGGDLGADPARRQVRLRAGAVDAADVDADGLVGRGGPGRHRPRGGCGAGVEAKAGEGPGCGGRGRGASRRGGGPGRGLSAPRLQTRVEEDRPAAADRVGGTALARRRRPEIDRAAVEPHAHPGCSASRYTGQACRHPHLSPMKADVPPCPLGGDCPPHALPPHGQGKRGQGHSQRSTRGRARLVERDWPYPSPTILHGDRFAPPPSGAPAATPARLAASDFYPIPVWSKSDTPLPSARGGALRRRKGPSPARARGPRPPSAGCGPAASRAGGRRSGGWRGGRTGR